MSIPDDLNPFRISWNRHGREQWDTMLAACRRPSLTQTSAYALALNAIKGDRAALGVIRFNNQPIGLVVAHGKPILGTPGSQTIYRGPLWVHDEIPGQMRKLAFEMLEAETSASWRIRPDHRAPSDVEFDRLLFHGATTQPVVSGCVRMGADVDRCPKRRERDWSSFFEATEHLTCRLGVTGVHVCSV